MGYQSTPASSPDSKVASIPPPRMFNLKENLTAWKRRMPSLLRAMGFGLLLSIVALVVSNSKISVEEDVKHRVAPRAFAGDFGDLSEGSEEHVRERALRQRPSPRLVGSQNAETKQFPWMVNIELRDDEPRSYCVCGGSLMSERWVLSAVHCFVGNYPLDRTPSRAIFQNFGLVAGMIDTHQLNPPTQFRGIDDVIPHPKWGGRRTMKYDVALVKADRNFHIITSHGSLAAVRLPEYSLRNTVTGRLTVSGFGRLSHGGLMPRYLQYTVMNALPDARCLQAYPKVWWLFRILFGYRYYSRTMLCAEAPGGRPTSAHGDSGGPVVQYTSGEWYQVGVVSWGVQRENSNDPDVYARVPFVVRWIRDTMRRG